MRILIYITIVYLMIEAYGCSKMQTKIDLSKVYKNDITIITRNPERTFDGMGTLPRKDLHTLEFLADDKVDLLFVRSCSREEVLREPKSIFNKRKFLYNYRPNEIEMSGNCGLSIHALSKSGLYSGGFLDVVDEYTTLPSHNVCGAITEQTGGTSVCQERVGSIAMIRFDVEVMTDPSSGCELESGNRGKQFEYKIKLGDCDYDFIETKPPYRLHRHTTHGYEEIRVGI